MTMQSKLDEDIEAVRREFKPGGRPIKVYRSLGMGTDGYVALNVPADRSKVLAELSADILADLEARLALLELERSAA